MSNRIENNKRFVFIILVLFTLMVGVHSGQAAEILTLEHAISLSIQNNPGLRAAEAQVEIAQAGVLRSLSGFLPKVNVSETYNRTNNPLMVFGTKLNQEIVSPADFNPVTINNPEPITNFNTRFSVMQPVFNGGKEYLGRSQAKLARDASVQDRERSRQETIYNVIKAYYGLLLAREFNKVANQSLQTSQENVRLADARFRAGAVLQSDVLRAKVQLAEVQEMLTRSQNGISVAAAALNFAMGVPQSNEYIVQEELTPKDVAMGLDFMVSEAISKRPDLLSVELNRRNAEKGISLARTDYLPNLNLMGQIDWNSTNFAGADARSWSVMAVLQWNIFDGLVTKSRVREAYSATQRMKAVEEQTKSSVQLQVRQAYYNLKASLDRIATTTSSVQEAEEGLRILQKRYEVGMTNFVDVLGAETALIRARNNALQALYDNNVSSSELKLATGTL